MAQIGFYPGEILLPNCNLEKWSVIACDQFTSQPEYWEEVWQKTHRVPSASKLIFPEAFLEKVDFNEQVASINENMQDCLDRKLFRSYPNSMVYTERTLHDGSVRRGGVGLLDLEEYEYRQGAASLARATEGTVLERIPARVRIRENAPLEMPHILVLIDDPCQTVIEPLSERTEQFQKLYDFNLMMNGGRIRGWHLDEGVYEDIACALAKLADPEAFAQRSGLPAGTPVLLYAVGDGNHSLAAAKECWERLKMFLSPEEAAVHPARYAMVELCNLRDSSLKFEAIHRAVFVPDSEALVSELEQYAEKCRGTEPPQSFSVLTRKGERTITIAHPERTLAVGSVQSFLDTYLDTCPGRVDYIHGEDVLRDLADRGAVGIKLPAMPKEDLFKTVVLEGALPRKTFSMGEASDKRYYLECRRIR